MLSQRSQPQEEQDVLANLVFASLKSIFQRRTVETFFVPIQFTVDALLDQSVSACDFTVTLPGFIQSATRTENAILTFQLHSFLLEPEEGLPVNEQYVAPSWFWSNLAAPVAPYQSLLLGLAGDSGVGCEVELGKMPTGTLQIRLYHSKGNARAGQPDRVNNGLREVFLMLRFTYAPLVM